MSSVLLILVHRGKTDKMKEMKAKLGPVSCKRKLKKLASSGPKRPHTITLLASVPHSLCLRAWLWTCVIEDVQSRFA